MASYRALFYRAQALRETDPEASVEQMTLASRLAREAGDMRGALYIDHWILQTLVHKLGDYARSYDLAVQAVLEARKPAHTGQMERICVHEDMIGVYKGIDPLGHIEVIEDAFNFMAQEITPNLECRHCMLGARIDFDLTCGDLERALADAQRNLAETEGSTHHHGYAQLDMAEIAYLQDDWEEMLQYADRALPYLRQISSNARGEASALAARALALRKLGRAADSQTAFQLATAKATTVTGVLSRNYYDFLCDYWLEENNVAAALELRDHELAGLVGKGQFYWEAICRLERIRLLKQLNRPYDEEASTIRALAAKLRDPQVILKPLDELSA